MTAESPPMTPFALAAPAYLAKGWSPIPLPEGEKWPPPPGWSGYTGAPRPSGADLHDWAENGYRSLGVHWAAFNLGIRLPDDVVGLDVDQYDAKRGGDELRRLEAERGPLPPTYVSTSRDNESGIRLFRVRRTGMRYKDPADGIEVIHHGWRYVIAAPSLHKDSGLPYRWLGPDGRQCAAPRPEDIPLLPEPWEELIQRGSADEVGKADLADDAAMAVLDGYPDGPMCPYLLSVVERARTEIVPAAAGSRHNRALEIVGAAVRGGEQGHHGSRDAVQAIWEVFKKAVYFGENKRSLDATEYVRMVTGAVALAVEKPTPEADRNCCGSRHGLTEAQAFDPTTPEPRIEFWTERETLRVIRQWARARMTSPWSVLACVLAEIVAKTSYRITLPAVVGSRASLNLFVALVGPSGTGKGASEAVARELLDLHEHPKVVRAHLGSGEGIAHLYAKRVKSGIERTNYHVMFSVPEVDSLTALGSRQGATLMGQVRQGWSGEALGFAYADPGKRLEVDALDYRMGLILGVQPGRGRALIEDAAGGTPQRLVWADVRDRWAARPDELPEAPPPIVWRIDELPGWNQQVEIPDSVRAEVREHQWRRHQHDEDALDGHWMLCRLKVATALALLEQRGVPVTVTEDDWRLSAVVMEMSDRARDSVRAHLSRERTQSNEARGEAEAARAVKVDSARWEAKVARVGRRLLRLLDGQSSDMTGPQLRKGVSSVDRDAVPEALEALAKTGQVKHSKQDGGDRYGKSDS